MLRTFLVPAGLVLGCLVGCQSKPVPSVPRQMVSLAIVVDASTSSSVRDGQQIADLRCPEVSAAVEQALMPKGLRQLDVLVVASGGKATSSEGRVVAAWRSFAPTARLFGRQVSRDEQRQAFIHNLEAECRSTLRPEKSSPIFFAIERAVTSLEHHARELSHGSEVRQSQSLIVLSDLRENVHPGIKQRLLAVSDALRRGKPQPPRPETVPVLKHDGIAVAVCGLAEHASGGGDDLTVSPEAITLVWQEILGEASLDASCRRPGSLPSVPGGTR